MNNTEKLDYMLTLQNKFNSIVSSQWRKDQSPWHRAVWLESAELIECLPWKWWKAKTPDMQHVRAEFVDIWHFILAWALDENEENILYNSLLETYHPYTDIVGHTELIAKGALNKDLQSTVVNFFRTLTLLDMEFHHLFEMYIGKNVLNKLRQDFGYKEGTYIKMWSHIDFPESYKEEDNEALMKLMSSLNNTNFTYEEIYEKLKQRYLQCRELQNV